MKFSRRAFMLAIAAAATVAACSAPASNAGPGAGTSGTIPLLRVGTNFPINTLNPVTNGGNAGLIDQLSLETLLNLGPNNTLKPELATSVSHPDPVTYIYHLRPGVKFWDGHPLTAGDVVFSWEAYRSPSSTYAAQFTAVKDIKASGPLAVTVTLSQPNAAWPYVPTQVGGVFEKAFYQAHQATFGNAGTLLMGTGPWEVDDFGTTGAKLSANPHWWGGTVPIKRVTVTTFAEESSIALAMRAGEIDVDPYVLDTATFASSSGATMLNSLTNTLAVFSMNTEVPPWNDVHVRRAAAYALNRADIIIAAAAGYNVPVYTYYMPAYLRAMASPAQVNALLGSVPQYRYDVAAAKAELAKSAYPHGVSVVLHEYTYGSSVNTAEVVAAELQKAGINAQVKVDENTAWEASTVGPDAKRPSYFSTGYCGGPDISSCDAYLGSSNLPQGHQNTAAWAPPAVDGLLKAALGATTPAARFTAYAQITKTIQADLPYIGLYQEGVSVGISSQFTVPGYAANPPLSALNDYALNIKAAR